MKKRLFSFSTLLLCCFQFINAQVWFNDGDTFVYDYGFWGETGYDEVTVIGDTVVNGVNCKSLQVYRETVCFNIDLNRLDTCYKGMIRHHFAFVEGDSVFMANENDDFKLQYDFSMGIGDSIFYYPDGDDWGYLLILDSIEQVAIQSSTRKKQYFTALTNCMEPTYQNAGYIEMIEGIGMVSFTDIYGSKYCSSYILPDIFFYNFMCISDGEHWCLRCYSSDPINYELVDDCYELPIVNPTFEELYSPDIEILPNPASNKLNLDIPSDIDLIDFEIYSMNGRKILPQNKGGKEINVSNLENGIYIGKLIFKNGIVNKRFVKL